MRHPDAIVVGGGVAGLTTAACLVDAGLSVRVWAADPIEETASYAAGATFAPFLVDDDRVPGWAEQTFYELADLAHEPETGVLLVLGREVSRVPVEAPEWAQKVPGFRPCRPAELPSGFVTGWSYAVPIIDMPVYLDHLRRRIESRGAVVERRRVSALTEAARLAPLVVNCTGLGAGKLAGDPSLRPVRGDLVVVENPGITEFLAEYSAGRELTYVLPQGDVIILGGTADDRRSDTEVDLRVAEGILARCVEIQPELRGAVVLEHRVGLRPVRDTVRVEREPGGLLHNYGHGGAGVSISWGCAREIAGLVT